MVESELPKLKVAGSSPVARSNPQMMGSDPKPCTDFACRYRDLMTPRILIVDDDSSIRTLLSVVASRSGVESEVASDGVEAMQKLEAAAYDVIVLDLSMPRMNGYDVIAQLRNRNPRPVVIVLTALPRTQFIGLDPEVVHCIIRKPFDLGTFMALFVATAADICAARRPANVVAFPQQTA